MSGAGEWTRLIVALPERQRCVLRMRAVWGLSAEETAQLLGTDAQTVRLVQHRALNTLRRRLRVARDRLG